MKIAFYSIVLNHHQACVADVLYEFLGDGFCFVELTRCFDMKGASDEFNKRPYLLRAWESNEAYGKAMQIALTAETCVFAGYEALPFERARIKRNLLSLDMGERLLKRGWLNLASPRILKMVLVYHAERWKMKPIYKLCCSAFTARDQNNLGTYRGKCYKWGYFTQVDEDFDVEAALDVSTQEITPLMWCSRFLVWKHPELPVQMAARLKAEGYKFHIRMYGDEGNAANHDKIYPRAKLAALIKDLGVDDCVSLMGNRPNREILNAMCQSAIFLFTSDRLEGWGAVANESMANACALVASDAIGSTPYLVRDGENGFIFSSGNVDSLTKKVGWLLSHPQELKQMQRTAYLQMKQLWSPRQAAKALLTLVDDLQNGRETSVPKGPCSKA